MPRRNLLPLFKRIQSIKLEMDVFVPNTDVRTVAFRADLAGLLVVLIAATYESCVKESLITFAVSKNEAFGEYTGNKYSKLNSKIQISDLYNYIKTFNLSAYPKFKRSLEKRQSYLNRKNGRDFQNDYKKILDWRHAFAHQGLRNTTIEEAFETHNFAKHVLYCFEEALNGP